jgi:hypothetical protein
MRTWGGGISTIGELPLSLRDGLYESSAAGMI